MQRCDCAAYDSQFDDRHARADLESYEKSGPEATTRALLDSIRAEAIEDATLLDIGGGVGVIHHELLDAGARSATHVDASAPYLRVAEEAAAKRGHHERVRFVRGDFVALAPRIPPADIVTLDRVICCYGDMESLVAASASRARRLYGVVFPRYRWFLRPFFAVTNVFKRITRKGFRVYLYPEDAIDAAIRRQGLMPRKQLNTFVWRVAVYSR